MSWLSRLLAAIAKPTKPTARQSASASRPASKPKRAKVEGKSYPVGIVGEASYQPAIKRCAVGERVQIVRELGIPYDDEAIAVVRLSGATIGYIGRDHWLYRAVNVEGKGCTAIISSIEGKPLGVVVDVMLTGRELGMRRWSRQS